MDISVVIPLFNEEESLDELSSWIDRVMKAHSFSYELIMIDDGSNDGSWKKIEEISTKIPEVNGIKFRRNYGKSAALNSGFEMAQGNVIITMDADLQDSPEEIPDLYKMIVEDDLDLVSGWKRKRKDPIMKTMPSKLFNWTTRKMTGIQLRDFNCGLKSYRKELVKNIEVYGEMHRYIPVIAKWAGFIKIGEKEVDHQVRKYGVTKFGVERFVNGFLDLLSISFVSKFGKRPMHLFGFVGTIMFMLGFLMAVYLGVDKLYYDTKARLIADDPLFYIALVVMILGTQMFLSGFLAEMIARSSHDRNKYQVEKVLKGASSRINE
ncbi:MAG TPA: glycosyltransferase [Flavobacteriales bacterium]|nr:glycosyltransferase [Flavobacteriales bacterium]HIA13201.1 glycosyltransferase [Flavobacteriales bacterium]